MIYWAFIGGIVFGVIVSKIFDDLRSGYGYFYTTPDKESNDPNEICIGVRFPHGQKLNKKSRIILFLDKKLSQK